MNLEAYKGIQRLNTNTETQNQGYTWIQICLFITKDTHTYTQLKLFKNLPIQRAV